MSLSLLYFNIVSVLSSVAVFIIGAVVYWNDRKSKICRYWFLSCLTASLWSLFFFLVINATTKELSFVLRVLMDTAAILIAVSYTHLRAHETVLDLVCRLLLEKKKTTIQSQTYRNLSTYIIY